MLTTLFDFLFSLNRVHFGPATRFSFVYDYKTLIVLLAIALFILGYLTYLWQSASPRKKKAMGILRGFLLALVLVLAFRPQLVMEREERLRSTVAIWVDNSRSMTLEDPYSGPSVDPALHAYVQKITTQLKDDLPDKRTRINRYELATATLADTTWLKDLAKEQDIMLFTGAGRAEVVGIASRPEQVDELMARLKSGKPQGDITDVPTIVRDIVERVQGQRVSALILLTDGQTTERTSRMDLAANLARDASTGIFAIPVGQEEEPFDLDLAEFRIPENTFAKDPISAHLAVSARGITQPFNAKVTVFRKTGPGPNDIGPELATKELTLDPTKLRVETDIPIKLEKKAPGKNESFELIARVETVGAPAGDERTQENNARNRTVTVHEAQINVLYVEGYPRWEYRFLTTELIREPTVNIATLLVSADAAFKQDADARVIDPATGEETFPGSRQLFPDTAQELAKFDVLLIGDVEPTFFSPTQQKLIVDWVRTKGGGVGWVSGNAYTPELFRESTLEVLLPIIPDEIDPRARLVPLADNVPYSPALTPAGRETNLFRFFDDPDLSWKEVANLPPMFWFKPVQGLKPGAVVLATHPSRSQAGNPAPLLVTRQYGAGPVLFSAYCDTWRWRRYTGEPLFQTYWLQMCRLLYAGKAMGQGKRLELLAESNQIEIGGQMKLSLIVKDPTLTGQLPPDVPILVQDDQQQTIETITLSRAAGAPDGLDKLEGTAALTRAGTFRLVPRPGILPVQLPPIEIKVQAPQREFESVTADMAALKTISTRTSGETFPPHRAAELVKKIPDRSMPILHAESEELWNKPIALILVLLLATGEWLLRKSAGLI